MPIGKHGKLTCRFWREQVENEGEKDENDGERGSLRQRGRLEWIECN